MAASGLSIANGKKINTPRHATSRHVTTPPNTTPELSMTTILRGPNPPIDNTKILSSSYGQKKTVTKNVPAEDRLPAADMAVQLVAKVHDLERKNEELESALVAQQITRGERKELERLQADEAARDALAKRVFEPRIITADEHTSGSPGFPMTIWSDWHWGETVSLEETGGLNSFDYDIAIKRVDNLVNRSLTLLESYGGLSPEYPGIWICLGGDMLSGGIHDELVETNWAPAVGQAFEVHSVIAGALLRMAEKFGKVYIPCVVGNHGRNAKKPRAKMRIRENSEYWLYKALQRHFADDPRFEFIISEQTDVFFEVYGHKFLLTHGDALGVRGGDGIIGSIGPIMRGSIKTNQSEAKIGRDFNTMIIGHWHSVQPRGDLLPVIVNGTLKGYDEYARAFLRASANRPSQALWLVSPKHGIAAQWPVYCD
jgi:hypothetical protein